MKRESRCSPAYRNSPETTRRTRSASRKDDLRKRYSVIPLARSRAHLARMRFLSNAREGIIELSREKHEKSVNAEMRSRERATAVLA